MLQLSTWSSRRPRLAALDWTTGGLPPATNSGNSALYKLAPAHPISSGATPVEAASAGSSPPSTAARGAKKAEYGGRMGTNPGPGRKPWPNDPSTVEARRLSPSPHLAAWPGFAVSWSEVGRARSRPFSTPNFFHLAMRVPVARTHDSFVCSARLRAKLTPPCVTCGEHAVGAWRGGRGPQREGQGPRRTNCLEKRQSWLAGVLSPRPARDVFVIAQGFRGSKTACMLRSAACHGTRTAPEDGWHGHGWGRCVRDGARASASGAAPGSSSPGKWFAYYLQPTSRR